MTGSHGTSVDAPPKGWSSDRLKDLVTLRDGKSKEASAEEDYLELEDIESGSGRILRRRDTINVESGVTEFQRGDVLFGKLRPYLEKYCLADFDGKCTGEILAFKPERINGRFLVYRVASPWFIDRCKALAYGAKMPRVNWPTQLAQFDIPRPPLAEQGRIAAFLDASCAAIDAAVDAKRRQIETLDLRLRSIYFTAVTRGLEAHDELWAPQHPVVAALPVGWSFVAIKRLVSTKITDGPHETPELVDDGVQFVSAEAIKGGRIDFNYRRGFISPELHAQYSRKCLPQRNDIFIIKSGATTGNVACVDVDFEFSIWSPLALVRCDERKLHYRFAYYVFLTDVFRKQVELSWSFGTQQNIGMRVIERLKVPLPPLEEQHAISLFLDAETAKVEQINATIVAQIDTLIAYRKSLIHECVTGRRLVAEADLERAQAHG